MSDTIKDRAGRRVNSPMWGDMVFPHIESDEGSARTLADIKEEVAEWQLLYEKLFNIPRAKISSVRWNNRLRKTCGRCHRNKDIFALEFNPTYVQVCSADNFHELIAHEVMHTLPGACSHGSKFKQYAAILGRVTTVHVSRLSCDEDFRVLYNERREAKIQYEISCLNCGRVVGHRERMCKLVNHPEEYRCAYCQGKIKVTKII